MSKWIRKGDQVVVIAGNDKGKTGTVIARSDERVLVQGVNIRKRHTKSRVRGTPSQILEMERPIHISNVSLCNKAGQPVKVKVRVQADGQKELFYLEDGKEVVHRNVVKHS